LTSWPDPEDEPDEDLEAIDRAWHSSSGDPWVRDADYEDPVIEGRWWKPRWCVSDATKTTRTELGDRVVRYVYSGTTQAAVVEASTQTPVEFEVRVGPEGWRVFSIKAQVGQPV
jgi:hypothetical protein